MMTFSSFRLLLLPSLTSISRQSISILGGCWHTLHSSCPLMVQCRTPLPLFMNLVTHRHPNTPEPHPLVHISETNAREIMKFEKKPNDDISKLNSCLSFDVDDQLSSAALSSYLTLNPSPLRAWCWHHSQSVRTLNSRDRKSCHIPHLLNQVLFSQAAHFQVLQRQALREIGVNFVQALFRLCWNYTKEASKMLTLSNSWTVLDDDENMWYQGSVLEQFDTFPFYFDSTLSSPSPMQWQKLFNDDENMWH